MTAELRVSVDGQYVASLEPGTEFFFGRGTDSDLCISQPLISRRHARLHFDRVWILEDLDTVNGTWVQGSEIEQVSLSGHHEVRFGGPDDDPVIQLEVVTDQEARRPVQSVAPFAPLHPVEGEVVVIGRDEQCDLVLDDPMVSSRHAELEMRDGTLVIRDKGSTNQTIVNGEAVTEAALADGDRVLIGNSHLEVRDGVLRASSSDGGLVVQGATLALRDGRVLVDDVSFAVDDPSVVAIIGPSGAGKSSLLRLLSGQVAPTSGSVSFRGATMLSQRRAFRGEIGVVPQFNLAHRRLTARQALEFTAQLRFADDASDIDRHRRIDATLHQLGLTAHAETRIELLSGGEQRRVSIAMEMLTEPSMLILDEPTSGLDPSRVLQVMQMLRGFADAGKQVLIVTHDLESLHLVDRVIILRAGGSVAYAGPPSGVIDHFGQTSWAEIFTGLIEARPRSASLAPPASLGVPMDVPVPTLSPGQVLRRAATVARRHFQIIRADPIFLALLIAMPVVLALMALAIPAERGLEALAPEPGSAPDAGPGRILSVLTLGAVFLGLAGAIRDLVGERDLFRHEREAGLPPLSYVLAKSFVWSTIAAAQSVVMVTLVLGFRRAPAEGVQFTAAFVELLIAATLTAVCCVMLGLAVSSAVGSTEQVMPPLVLLVMGQLVLCGGLFPLAGRPVLEQLAWFAPARWGYAAAASTTDLNAVAESPDRLWNHELSSWLLSVDVLVLLTVAFWLAAWFGASRREKY